MGLLGEKLELNAPGCEVELDTLGGGLGDCIKEESASEAGTSGNACAAILGFAEVVGEKEGNPRTPDEYQF